MPRRILLALLAASLARTALDGRPDGAVEAGPRIEIPAGAAGRLADALRFPTLAGDAEAFLGLHAQLRDSFPRVHAELRREVVAKLSLLYTWEGSDPALRPLLLLGHLDVVPAEAGWRHPPFAGRISDGAVWGRGAIDHKSGVVGMLEAVELLLAEGVRPARTVHLAFGHDEEVGGLEGARAMAALLRSRGVRPELILDEGGVIAEGVLDGVAAPVALVGVAEKGFVSLELSVTTPGGHSSLPPPRSAIGILAAAIARLESRPMEARLDGATREMFDRLGPALPFSGRWMLANLWLTRPLLLRRLESNPTTNAMVRTTAAVTVVQGGTKENVLPTRARAVVNARILPGDRIEDVIEHARVAIGDPRVEVAVGGRFSSEPSPVSDSRTLAFRTLERAIRREFDGVKVAPYLVVVATDARHYQDLSPSVYRFLPIRLGSKDLERLHGVDERIELDRYEELIRAYRRILLEFQGLQ